ncbi:NADH-quinone oxidoreductase subunit M [Cohaesibacter marisflavi]|uniref:NADH-quinone oxidoreductase subunit M n=1 Tax=Cohaesibacter marisflavi TaxID=655353 RepID=UPI0029C759EB|nr:NADH-quinone oxidoreductase subunit M [Cohaesibacter marisflavi]
MSDWPLLSTVVFLPLVGAMMILLVKGDTAIARRNITNVALWTTVVTFLISLLILSQFDSSNAGFQMQETADWLGGSIAYRMGVDGISILFVILTTALMPAAIYASRNSIQKRVKEYMIAFLVLETMMIGVFCALDLVLFYLFFEAGLIPMFLIIGIWGGQNRVYASFKFFLYTLAGSVLMLLAVMAMYWDAGTTDIVTLLAHPFSPQMQTWLWLAFFASFAVKMPMWPVHTWLPDAHVQAPTAGSVILAGVLLKMGGYGFLRFSLPMFPIASDMFAPLVYTLSVIAIIYTSLVALAQQDIKKLIAYSSVAHMGYVTMGVFSMTEQGVQGGIFQMISHGIVSGALFLCVGVVYDRMHTREISAYGGLVNRMPVFATLFMIFTMANVGLPGTSGFIGEFLTIIGVFQVNTWVALFAATGVILSASYALWLYRRIIFGKLEKESLKGILDMDIREKTILVPLAVLTILFGFYPAPIQNVTAVAVENLINNYQAALSAADKLALLAQ